jgi:hypothetical protein
MFILDWFFLFGFCTFGHMGRYSGHMGKYGGHMGKYGGHMGKNGEPFYYLGHMGI